MITSNGINGELNKSGVKLQCSTEEGKNISVSSCLQTLDIEIQEVSNPLCTFYAAVDITFDVVDLVSPCTTLAIAATISRFSIFVERLFSFIT